MVEKVHTCQFPGNDKLLLPKILMIVVTIGKTWLTTLTMLFKSLLGNKLVMIGITILKYCGYC
jgi:hypothetical protein